MLMLGGDLKRKEMLSARLGDVLSHLYIASAVLKFYEDNGRQVADLPFVHYSVQRNLYEIGRAFAGFFSNFPNRLVGKLLKGLVFPFGINYQLPDDEMAMQISDALLKPSVIRDRLTHLCYLGEGENDPTGSMEQAFLAVHAAQPLMKKIFQAQKDGKIARKLPLDVTINKAAEAGVLSAEEVAQLEQMNKLRFAAISVDSFKPGDLESRALQA